MHTLGTSTLLRLRPCVRSSFFLYAATRQRDVHHFLSSSFSRYHDKAAQSTTQEASKDSSPPGTMESSEKTVSVSPRSQKVHLDAFRTRLKERASAVSTAATLSLAEIGERLNKVTGYEHIEVLKRKVVETEAAISAKRQASRDAKAAYETAVARRCNSQREVNELLQRKSNWNDADVGRFTDLVREDHLYEQEEARAKTKVALAEAEVEVEFNELMRSILSRYHEEQVWSDKIRSASTYGSFMALGVNIVVFFLAIVVVEPWKRRRLALTFEKRIEELSLENHAAIEKGINDLTEHLQKQERAFAQLIAIPQRDTEMTDAEPRPDPALSVAKMTKTARDRDLWVASAIGLVGGGVLTLLVGFLKG